MVAGASCATVVDGSALAVKVDEVLAWAGVIPTSVANRVSARTTTVGRLDR